MVRSFFLLRLRGSCHQMDSDRNSVLFDATVMTCQHRILLVCLCFRKISVSEVLVAHGKLPRSGFPNDGGTLDKAIYINCKQMIL